MTQGKVITLLQVVKLEPIWVTEKKKTTKRSRPVLSGALFKSKKKITIELRMPAENSQIIWHQWNFSLWLANFTSSTIVYQKLFSELICLWKWNTRERDMLIDPMQKWPPLNYSFVRIQNSLTNLVRNNKFFTIFVSKTRLVRLI